ncbi:ML domain-containing protein [Mycena epipterygia]|nr:ML domain-containing protein [Mycena epipterygia]
MHTSALYLSLTALLLAALYAPVGHANPAQQRLSTPAPLKSVGMVAAGRLEYTSCGRPSDAIVLESIAVSPDPPVAGQDLTITVRGRTTQRIEDGAYADVAVRLGLIKLLNKQYDVCQQAQDKNVSVQCPIDKGVYEVVHTVALRKEIPPAQFHVAVRGYTDEDRGMLCLDLTVDFRR